MRGALPRLVSFAVSCPEFLRAGLGIDPASASLQICEHQRAEDLDAVIGKDRPGPLPEEQMVPDEENASAAKMTDDEETASDGEALLARRNDFNDALIRIRVDKREHQEINIKHI